MSSERKENVELLTENNRGPVISGTNGSAGPRPDPPAVPDGGLKAYTVVLASFFTNGLMFGIINSYSVIYSELIKRLKNVENAEVKASLAGGLTIGTTFALSPVSGILTGYLGLRRTAIIGGSIATVGMLLTSFVVDHVEAICFTYGIMFGMGASLAYTPSLAILGLYFKKRLGIVNGLVTVGSCVFTIFMPDLMDWMILNVGLEWMFRLLSLFTLGIVLCGLMFTPVAVVLIDEPVKAKKSLKAVLKTIGCLEMWKISRYRVWALSIPVALFGYFVPYVHIKKLTELNFPEHKDNNLAVQCIAITSAIGRITFGLLADRKCIDSILLQQISFYVIGTLTIILPFVTEFGYIIAIALGMGLFEGGFIALMGPIAFELVGTAYAAQGIGCVLGLAALPLSLGPSIAGTLFKSFGNYTLAFVLAGLSPIFGGSLMFLIRFTMKKKESNQAPESNSNGHVVTATNKSDVENNSVPLLVANGRANHHVK